MLLLERLLAPLAQRHDGGHVDLVEGREHRRGVLRLDQPPRDRRAALRHALRVPRGARRCGAAARPAWRRRGGALGVPVRRRAAGAIASWHVLLRHAAGVAEPGSAVGASTSWSCAGVARRGRGARRRRRRRWSAAARLQAAGAAGGGALPAPSAAGGAPRAVVEHARAARRSSRPRLPVRLMLARTPPRSALTSRSIFSVSSSTSGSPTATRSPSFFSQRATRASTTDSPSCGTTMLDMTCRAA